MVEREREQKRLSLFNQKFFFSFASKCAKDTELPEYFPPDLIPATAKNYRQIHLEIINS
jgi:hypothetical protein